MENETDAAAVQSLLDVIDRLNRAGSLVHAIGMATQAMAREEANAISQVANKAAEEIVAAIVEIESIRSLNDE